MRPLNALLTSSSAVTSNTASTENAPPSSPPQLPDNSSTVQPSPPSRNNVASTDSPADALPPPLTALLTHIKTTLATNFPTQPPHTVQRLAELVLRPKDHYTRLHTYLNALDRVVSVSSSNNNYPLPASDPLSPHLVNGTGHLPYSVGTHGDDGLGGALLTPIPWLVNGTSRRNSASSQNEATLATKDPLLNGAEESNEEDTSMTTDDEVGVTQGELLRQQQEESEPPAPIGSADNTMHTVVTSSLHPIEDGALNGLAEEQDAKDETSMSAPAPAEGPSQIGMEDIGAQENQAGSGQVLNLEAAVGRGPATEAEAEEVRAEMASIGQDVEMADVENSLISENLQNSEQQGSIAATGAGDEPMVE